MTLFRVPSEAYEYDARSFSARSYRYLKLGDIEINSSSRFSMRWATSSRATLHDFSCDSSVIIRSSAGERTVGLNKITLIVSGNW